jgi:hypothetical protein
MSEEAIDAEVYRQKCAAKDAELARLRGVEKVLRKARAFVGGLRGSQFASEQQHTEAYAVIHAIDNALSALPSPAEAGEKPCGCGHEHHDRHGCLVIHCPCGRNYGESPAAKPETKGRGDGLREDGTGDAEFVG